MQKQKLRRDTLQNMLYKNPDLSTRQAMRDLKKDHPHLAVESHTTIAEDFRQIKNKVDV